MTESTQPLHITILYAVLVIFAIVGVFSSLGFFHHLNQQRLLYGENAITTDVTVSSLSCADSQCRFANGFVDTNGRGYVIDGVFSFSRMDPIAVGHTYTIKYFCNILDGNDRTVMEMIDHATNPYTCITENGVCK